MGDLPQTSPTETPGAFKLPSLINLRADFILAQRYRLVRLLGRGGQSAVWLATDRVSGESVAVKALPRRDGADAARVRREVAALRRLRIPGVARLLDEGIDGDVAFVVLEPIEGRPFPGGPTPIPWPQLEPIARRLLTTLGAVHASGVVHRDLKPSNILVSPEGEPVVLDFGVSWGSLEGAITRRGEILGTPSYLAPEQVLGDQVTPAADLYAFGAMLYEALSGVLPFEGGSVQAILFARCFRPAPPLRAQAPGVPLGVAAVVDRLLSRLPEARYANAALVIAALEGAEAPRVAAPWLGPRDILDDGLDRLRSGAGVAVCGPPGSGRTRVLDALAEALSAEGRRVLRVEPCLGPFASLDAAFTLPRPSPDDGLDAVLQALRGSLAEALAGGAVLVDDFDQVDPWSARLLVEAAQRGPVALACGVSTPLPAELPRLALSPFSLEVLSTFIAGHQRVLHLVTDATHCLFARTGALPRAVHEELDRWVRDGIGARDGDKVRVTREGLSRVEAALRQSPPGVAPPPGFAAGTRQTDLLRWICVGWPTATASLLQSVTGEARWSIEAELVAMRDAGLIAFDGADIIVPHVNLLKELHRTREDDRHRHHRLAQALRPGAEGRLRHLRATLTPEAPAEALDAVLTEALVFAERLAAQGALALAVIALSEALDDLRRWGLGANPRPEAVIALLHCWTLLALAEGTPRALDRALDQLALASDHPGLAQLEALSSLDQLLRAALALPVASERARRLVEPLLRAVDPGVRRAARDLTLHTMSTSPPADRAELIDRWRPPRDGGASAPEIADKAAWCAWVGLERAREGRPREAVVAFSEAVRLAPWETVRIGAMLDAAGALLSMGALDAAREEAEAARVRAARCRHAHHEATAEWLLRTVALAEGRASPPDWELLEVVAFLDTPELATRVVETEAAHAVQLGLLREAERIRASLPRSGSGHSILPLTRVEPTLR